MRMGDRAECLLGNHELHLLAVYAGQRAMSPEDTISEILNAPDCEDIIQWLRNRPLALVDHGFYASMRRPTGPGLLKKH